ncbi:phage baseplate assembly protein V [Rhizobium sp. 1AS11]|uniref:phage baseplate assembly protein V n=1 Tax=Rhizobium acaciae TaxID=2989736 RepID=UPI00222162D8|nr:phage baseplate assembly protein V [Rhizobium acaciae]MCW1412208.1 phage baseplate assembly protein V [Rhizobium acaciae]MCW1744223.1 phage baseplate assembly protein V [Rhizobium acaciae]
MSNRYDAEITDLKRRVSNGVLIGTVSQRDEKGRYRVKVGDLETDWIPAGVRRAGKTKEYSYLEVDEQVVLASPSGDLSQAVVLAAIPKQDTQASDKFNIDRKVYEDGTVIEYDHEAKRYRMTVAEGGSYELNLGGGASIVASGDGLTLKAPGRVTIESDELFHNAKNVGDSHEHTDVIAGSDNTGPPA